MPTLLGPQCRELPDGEVEMGGNGDTCRAMEGSKVWVAHPPTVGVTVALPSQRPSPFYLLILSSTSYVPLWFFFNFIWLESYLIFSLIVNLFIFFMIEFKIDLYSALKNPTYYTCLFDFKSNFRLKIYKIEFFRIVLLYFSLRDKTIEYLIYLSLNFESFIFN